MSDTYIDSRGAEMQAVKFSDALDLVYDLANENLLDERDAVTEQLAKGRARNARALEVVRELIDQHRDVIDALEAPKRAGDWDDRLTSSEWDMDPNPPLNAVRIVLDMGMENALDPREAERDALLADEVDRQQQAFDVVKDLIGMHGEKLEHIAVSGVSEPPVPGG